MQYPLKRKGHKRTQQLSEEELYRIHPFNEERRIEHQAQKKRNRKTLRRGTAETDSKQSYDVIIVGENMTITPRHTCCHRSQRS